MSEHREPAAWWPYVKNVIRKYPSLREKLRALKSCQTTARYGKAGGGSSEPGRSTEAIALRELPENEQHYLDAVERAIRSTRRKPDGALRVKLIRLMYFEKSHTLSGAATVCHVSEATAKRWHGDFVRCVAKHLGLK